MAKIVDGVKVKMQDIKDYSLRIADTEGLNPAWKRAWLDLADAADRIHAMSVRSEVPDTTPSPTGYGK